MILLLVLRLLWTRPILFGVVIAAFLMLHLVPGGLWDSRPQTPAMFTVSADRATRKTLEPRFGLDKPLWRLLARYVFGDLDGHGCIVWGSPG